MLGDMDYIRVNPGGNTFWERELFLIAAVLVSIKISPERS